MTGMARLRQARAVLVAAVAARAALTGAALAVAVLAVFAGLDVWLGLPRDARSLARPMALGAGTAAVALAAWRDRRVTGVAAVALWLERRVPALRFALVTLLESGTGAAHDQLEAVVGAIPWRRPLGGAAARALAGGLVPLSVAAFLLVVLPAGAVRRVASPQPGDALDHPRSGGPLATVVVTVAPPRYTGMRDTVLEDPVAVIALAGATLTVEGPDLGAPIAAARGEVTVDVASAGSRWRAVLAMPTEPTLLRLAAGADRRVIVLDPVADSAPRVSLRLPARDTVLPSPSGPLVLDARATDDFGVARLWFEYIVSAGEGEIYTFRTGRIAAAPSVGRMTDRRARLRLDTLGIEPGNVLHLRAVAHDANDVTGPGRGVSQTRSIRIARPGEYDSLALATAPPLGGDTALLSQRMLIVRAETLVARSPRLPRDRLVDTARAIGHDQARLRRQVADIIFLRLGLDPAGEHAHDPDQAEDLTPEALLRAAEASTGEAGVEALDFHGDETPVVAVNRPLLEAYNAMWDAGRRLEVGQPASALPYMYAALEAIQRARRAERVYLRGRAPSLVLDLARARLAGDRRDAAPAPRAGAPDAEPDDRARLRARLEAALALVPTAPVRALDSIAALRLSIAGRAPDAAAALEAAIETLRQGRDPTTALGAARAALAGQARHRAGLAPWGVGW